MALGHQLSCQAAAVHAHLMHLTNIQATSKGSDQTARMRRLVCAFAART